MPCAGFSDQETAHAHPSGMPLGVGNNFPRAFLFPILDEFEEWRLSFSIARRYLLSIERATPYFESIRSR
jgi:hypothetical protein